MPINYKIDHEARVVLAAGHGKLDGSEIFDYQRTVWSRPDVQGYNELMDMTNVTQVSAPSPERIQELAALSARMDPKGQNSRFAIVAPEDLAFGLGRMFQTQRSFQQGGTKEVGVFRTMPEALAFLGINRTLAMPGVPE